MLIYGITGGIGSGKSTVAALIEEHGYIVFNADAIGRELLSKRSTLTQKVLRHFPTVALKNGAIDRRKLGALVFADPQARRTLEGIMHPAIWRELLARIEALKSKPAVCFLEAALLADYEVPVPLAGLLLVTAPLSVRIRRACERDGISQKQALARVRAQSSDEHKMLKATHVIDNGRSPADTKHQVEEVLRLLALEGGWQTLKSKKP